MATSSAGQCWIPRTFAEQRSAFLRRLTAQNVQAAFSGAPLRVRNNKQLHEDLSATHMLGQPHKHESSTEWVTKGRRNVSYCPNRAANRCGLRPAPLRDDVSAWSGHLRSESIAGSVTRCSALCAARHTPPRPGAAGLRSIYFGFLVRPCCSDQAWQCRGCAKQVARINLRLQTDVASTNSIISELSTR